ncbi:MAG: hypothetical protein KatS3mg093_378 [Candidatus Parcubacteria bacterium]|nr:MAG: hypothetical protein KatS3mg093_378 [Candidatus Parcubacteria bacterium]
MKKHLISILLFFIAFIIFSYKLPQSISFEGDLARDLYEIEKISLGDFTLLGPKSSFGGIYTTPYYYYLFVPAFVLSGKNINGVIFFNALLFSLTVSLFYLLLSSKYKKHHIILIPIVLMLLPFFIFSARNPGNGFSHIPFFILFLVLLYFSKTQELNTIQSLFLGFLFGFIISMQFSYIPLVIPILFLLLLIFKNKKIFISFILGISLSLIPLLVFEIKNDFIMIKNTFINKSYLSFVENKNLPNGVQLNKNIFANALFLQKQMSNYLNMNPFLIILFILFSSFFTKNKKLKLLNANVVFSFLLLVYFLRFQYSFHYLFPFLTLLTFVFLINLAELNFGKLILPLILVLLILDFPKHYYNNAQRQYNAVNTRINKILDQNWINKNDKLNVLLIRKDNAPTPAGFEYRFFLLKNGFNINDQFSYNTSNKLIIISEKQDLNLDKIKNWELTEFGLEKTKSIKSIKLDKEVTAYVLEK